MIDAAHHTSNGQTLYLIGRGEQAMNHAPEPWTSELDILVDANRQPIVEDDGDMEYTTFWISDENQARIVACVNACRGISDPAAFMEKVRGILDGFREYESPHDFYDALDDLATHAPGHEKRC